ncbi:zinc finger CCHC domain-containing protein 4 isoform X1 [Arapaima gigas]
MSGEEGFAVEVIVDKGDGRKAPSCPHGMLSSTESVKKILSGYLLWHSGMCRISGPTLLFQRVCGGQHSGRRFFACSACRDRKDCSFFQWEDEQVSEARLLARERENEAKRPRASHAEWSSRLGRFVSLPLDQRRFCEDCQLLLLRDEWGSHSSHAVLPEVPANRLRRPSLLLRPLENKKSNAQYLFTDRSCRFLLDLLHSLGFRKVLCVGTPRLHELIKLRNLEAGNEPMRSLLLDIDFRYTQFYTEDEFCHYNMFNNHFFSGEAAIGVFNAFLNEEDGAKVVMVTDPPFGGLVKPLAHSFSQISETWRALQTSENTSHEMPMFWIFPYFFESRILECFSTFSMLDYQVDYDNHPLYKHGKSGRKQSPVRLFTNVCPRDVILPEEEGYRFCSICERYVSSGNKHCTACNACTSKDGREWRHCSLCSKCVKPTWLHCPKCNRCALPEHPCGSGEDPEKCFLCGSPGHKRRACPRGAKQRTISRSNCLSRRINTKQPRCRTVAKSRKSAGPKVKKHSHVTFPQPRSKPRQQISNGPKMEADPGVRREMKDPGDFREAPDHQVQEVCPASSPRC